MVPPMVAPLMGITPIMEYTREHYGRDHAPNIRETLSKADDASVRGSRHRLVQPRRSRASRQQPYDLRSGRRGGLAGHAAFGTPRWEDAVENWLKVRTPLAAKWARNRVMYMVWPKTGLWRSRLAPTASSSETSWLRSLLASHPAPRSSMWAIPGVGFSSRSG